MVFTTKVFKLIVGIPIGTNFAPLLADIFLYSCEAEFIQTLLSTGRKQFACRFNFTHRYIDDVLSITTKSLKITWARCIPLNLRSKNWQRATLLLFTWVYFCRLGGKVNFILPFMTNVTISISISPIFRPWVAIYQLRPPMGSLSHSLYIMPGLAPSMNVLFWGRHDFRISLPNRDTSRKIVIEEVLLSTSYQAIRSSSLMNAKWYSEAWQNTMTTLYWSDFIPIRDLFTELDLLLTYVRFP